MDLKELCSLLVGMGTSAVGAKGRLGPSRCKTNVRWGCVYTLGMHLRGQTHYVTDSQDSQGELLPKNTDFTSIHS